MRREHPHKFAKGAEGVAIDAICLEAGCFVRFHQVYSGWPEALKKCPIPADQAPLIGVDGK